VVFLLSVAAHAQSWHQSYSDALARAQNEDKPIILVFSGSDWCAPCIKLDRTIWQSRDFKIHAQDNYVLYKADFPRKKANQLPEKIKIENQGLADTFNPDGHFPLVLVLDKDQKVLGKIGYQKISPGEYISLLNTFLK
jgi:thioredoxin-related protein